MKTKEERAELALRIYTSEDIPQYDEYAEGVQAGQAYGFKDGYIVGAEEQKAIDDDENGKALLYAVNKTTERVKREMINKACEFILESGHVRIGGITRKEFVEYFRKAMEE